MLINIALRLVSLLLSFAVTRFLVQNLGLVEFGMYSYFVAIMAVPLSLRFLGSDLRLHKALAAFRSKRIVETYIIAGIQFSTFLSFVFAIGLFIYFYSFREENSYLSFVLMFYYIAMIFMTFLQDFAKFNHKSRLVHIGLVLFFSLQAFVVIALYILNLEFSITTIFTVLVVPPLITSAFFVLYCEIGTLIKLRNYNFFKLVKISVFSMSSGYVLVIFGLFEALKFALLRHMTLTNDGALSLGVFSTGAVILGFCLSLIRSLLVQFEPLSYKFGKNHDYSKLRLVTVYYLILITIGFLVSLLVNFFYGNFWISILLPNDHVESVVEIVLWYHPLFWIWSVIIFLFPVSVSKNRQSISLFNLSICSAFGMIGVLFLSETVPVFKAQLILCTSFLVYVVFEMKKLGIFFKRIEIYVFCKFIAFYICVIFCVKLLNNTLLFDLRSDLQIVFASFFITLFSGIYAWRLLRKRFQLINMEEINED